MPNEITNPDATHPAEAPDTARSYERAKPQNESPEGKLGQNPPAGKDRPDDYSDQNKAPDKKVK